GALGAALHGGYGHYGEAGSGADLHARIHHLVGKERVVIVVEHGLQLEGAGRRVNGIVNREQVALSEELGVGAVEGGNIGVTTGGELAVDLRQILLGKGEEDRDRLDLGNDRHGLGVAGVDDVAGIHLAEADAAGDGGGDLAVREVQSGGLDRGLVAGHRALVLVHECSLRIKLLLGNDVLLVQGQVALIVNLIVVIQGGVMRELALGLGKGSLVGTGINIDQQV